VERRVNTQELAEAFWEGAFDAFLGYTPGGIYYTDNRIPFR